MIILFKAGSTALPTSYRPISLLSIGYKILAGLLLDRLRKGGVESRLRDSQFGFRKHRSTQDAIFMAKRIVEDALAKKDGTLSMILLDWSKAFDKILPSAMLEALLRFGLPPDYVTMVAAIYECRYFCVRDGGKTSTNRIQASGMAQGCSLSP